MKQVGGQSEVDPLMRVLLKHPVDAFPEGAALDAEWKALGYHRKPDPHAATEEYDAFAGILEDLGVQTHRLPAHSETGMDSVYTRDASLITDRGVILCNMGKPARSGEPEAQGEAFLDMGVPVLGRIEGEGRLEGGDVVWLDQFTLLVGRGYRSNDEGIRQLEELLRGEIEALVTVPLPHWKGPGDVFHLMSVLSPLDRRVALVYSPLLPVPFREFLIYRGISLVEVPREEFETMACNVLAVAPGVCLMLEGNPRTRRRLEEAGMEVHTYRGQEISAPGEGGPTCLTRPFLRSF